MQDPLATSLVVTGVGMLALFVALALLCGLMYLMTAFIKDPPVATLALDEETPSAQEGALRAAVIAVALARAEQELLVVSSVERQIASAPPLDETSSAWRALHHQRQLLRTLRTRKTL